MWDVNYQRDHIIEKMCLSHNTTESADVICVHNVYMEMVCV